MSTKHNYEILINDGAIQRCQMPNKRRQFTGTWEELCEYLQDHFVDVPGEYDDMDDYKICSKEQFIEEYADYADFGGSTLVLRIKEDGTTIFEMDEW